MKTKYFYLSLFAMILIFACTKTPLKEEAEETILKKPETVSIVGGQPIQISNRPYQVFFDGPVIGGGVIISPEWILTAAHVVHGHTANQFQIRAGSTSVDPNSFVGQTTTIAEIIEHPDYIGSNTNPFNDIALVRLSTPLTMDANCHAIYYIYPDQLSYQAPGQTARASGWGQIGGNNSNSSLSQLLYADMELVSPTNPYFVNFPFFQRSNKELYTRRNSASQENVGGGDSGGPLTVNIPNWGDVLVGVVARGMPFNDDGPSAFTKISEYVSWIQQHTGIGRPQMIGEEYYPCGNIASFAITGISASTPVTWSSNSNGIAQATFSGNVATLTKLQDGVASLHASINLYGTTQNFYRSAIFGIGIIEREIDGFYPEVFKSDHLSLVTTAKDGDQYYRWYINGNIIKQGNNATSYCTCEDIDPRIIGANTLRLEVDLTCGGTDFIEYNFTVIQ